MFLTTLKKLSTINKVTSLGLGSWPATVVLGLSFWALLLIFLVYKNKAGVLLNNISARSALLVLIAVAWLPMFATNIIADWQYILARTQLMGASGGDKLQSRLCAIDENQKLAGGVCLLEPFLQEVKNSVPAQSKVAVISDGYYLFFLQYYLMADYQVTDRAAADYWLLYLSKIDYQFGDDGHLYEFNGADKRDWGSWQVVKITNQGMGVLKK
jgi:hypothetical protein